MLLVVVAGDLIVLLVGWEVMGICSYFLIGHYWEPPDARAAAVKAFLVTRLGDVGFLFGIFVLGFAAGSFRIDEVIAAVAGDVIGHADDWRRCCSLCGVVRQVGAVPAAHLAAGRDGRPDADQRADPRRDDGRRRRSTSSPGSTRCSCSRRSRSRCSR